jgi:hypothetical protein
MFVGHYGAGFLIKKKYKKIPLWVLFLAVQFVDIIAFTLVLLGIEQMSYNPVSNPFLRTSIDYVPFTHSLLGTFIFSGLVLLIFWKLVDKTWGIALSIAVFSHWPIDFIAHTPDLPLIFNTYKVGLGLWSYPWIAFFTEISFFLITGLLLLKNFPNKKRLGILMVLLVISYTPTMFAPEKEVPVAVFSLMSLSFYFIFAGLAYWAEKKAP